MKVINAGDQQRNLLLQEEGEVLNILESVRRDLHILDLTDELYTAAQRVLDHTNPGEEVTEIVINPSVKSLRALAAEKASETSFDSEVIDVEPIVPALPAPVDDNYAEELASESVASDANEAEETAPTAVSESYEVAFNVAKVTDHDGTEPHLHGLGTDNVFSMPEVISLLNELQTEYPEDKFVIVQTVTVTKG